MKRASLASAGLIGSCLVTPLLHAHPVIEEVNVTGRHQNLIGESVSASEGVVSQDDIDVRALLRVGEVLELVPGMVVTQHSGTGKANQYFLRGFNLDHGTDFSTEYNGMPVNMRSHGHGQGYTDLNFIIPELVKTLHYQKGPYYADVGDFSGAGAASITPMTKRDQGRLKLTVGEYDYQRLLASDSLSNGNSDLLWAIEYTQYQGPWSDIDEDLGKLNVQLNGTHSLDHGTVSWGIMSYDNEWNSADQIPDRAVSSGFIDEYGSIDLSTGGQSHRHSINVAYDSERLHASAYAIDYGMNLWSNFTYRLDNPEHGDQFEQVDDRRIYGGELSVSAHTKFLQRDMENRWGLQIRLDDIGEVGLYNTDNRQRRGVVRSDAIDEFSSALFWENNIAWSDSFSTVLGARYDYYTFDVSDRVGVNSSEVNLSSNSGSASDDIVSLKASAIWRISTQWETYLSAGSGFHSNDARVTTITIDPSDGSAIDSVNPLVRSKGAEFGLRGFLGDKINLSAALWTLELDSELLFVGDAGNTEASAASARSGVELTAYYRIDNVWTLDVEYAYTNARFDDEQPGRYIPGAVEDVVQLGISANLNNGLFGSVRARYFGPRPLTETGDQSSQSTSIVNIRAGYQFSNVTLALDVLNALDSTDHDIDYYYASQLAGEFAPVEDRHFHPLEPRNVRVSLELAF
ncbi:TonB-dependent receptor [Gilvimarinus sp. SDUM040013]|uniref:TonB-dependent receptor n=1 Tax=Gilvimarinus gilvus TaxID=3058038 RepID=A0ABU4RZ53_9GAMM|nr:TonB-dependent receptor [Gilvimarinus sp. SDUM040013]MDO3385600.1 TonB-dependent receptor [Gilvimarinus sp. SDUM040013]MDX6849934.1 TonB-dependent receptor [Gilvimarinus sp. SDUM040013]